jgi:hypothetical protein
MESAGEGVFKTSSDGSCGLVGCLGCSETWLPQRARTSVVPSLSTFSPRARVTFFFVQ